jgi:hypothetical protein
MLDKKGAARSAVLAEEIPATNEEDVMARGMRLSAPTQVIFLISLALAVFALISFFVRIPNVTPHAFWIAIIAYVVLAVGCALRGV